MPNVALKPVDLVFVALALVVVCLFFFDGGKLKKFDVPLVFVTAMTLVIVPIVGLVAVGMHRVGLAGPVGIAQ